MTGMGQFAQDDGLALAARVAKGEVSAGELMKAALASIAALNPKLNAILEVLEGEGHRTLTQGVPAGPFSGVPFLIKEVALHAAGIPCRQGSRLSGDLAFPGDTELMARFRKAGFVTIGTTSTPEFGFNATTEPVRFGPTRNPWNLEHSAGGSSGGSGAAVAAGIVPIAHANDGGGSIRVPASTNGLFGLKPTRLRTPSGPDGGDLLSGLGVEFALTRSVRDAAALLDAVSAPEPGAPSIAPRAHLPYADTLRHPPRGLRIALQTTAPSGTAVDPEAVAAARETAALCAELGHHVEETAPRLDWESYLPAMLTLWAANLTRGMDLTSAALGVPIGPDSVEAASLLTYEHGRSLRAVDLLDAFEILAKVTRDFGAFFTTYDLLLTPTLTRPPPPLGELDQNGRYADARAWAEFLFGYVGFTSQANVTGQPAMSVPLSWTAAGLPMGSHFMARFGDEWTLLALAGQLEAARPWFARRPPLRA